MFGLFVEFMYYGQYNVISPPLAAERPDDGINMHARCWILGDKLLCTGFKNYAMSRLYEDYATAFGKKITTSAVRYALKNSAPGSPLERYYRDLLFAYFENSNRVVGTLQEWDALLLEHPDVRLALLQNLRMLPSKREVVRLKVEYME